MNKITHCVTVLAMLSPLSALAQPVGQLPAGVTKTDVTVTGNLDPATRARLRNVAIEPSWTIVNESLLEVSPESWPAGFRAVQSRTINIPNAIAADAMWLSGDSFTTCWNAALTTVGWMLRFSSGTDRGTHHGTFFAADMSAGMKTEFRSAAGTSSNDLSLDFVVGGTHGSDHPTDYFRRPIQIVLHTAGVVRLAAVRFSQPSGSTRRVQVARPDGSFEEAGVAGPAGGSSEDDLWVDIQLSASRSVLQYRLVHSNPSGTIDEEDEFEYPIDIPSSTWDLPFRVDVDSELTGVDCDTTSYNVVVLKNMTLNARSFRVTRR